MGIINSSLQAMIYAARHGVDFTSTLTVGRQELYRTGSEQVYKTLKKHRTITARQAEEIYERKYAEGVFEWFGAEKVDSIDYSDYEKATIIHDMNIPVANELKNRYSLVWDGGTLEHVFDYPTALRNCMEMVAPQGHLILQTPANNFFGHGFYQFSPELYFSVLTEKNGFTDTRLLIEDGRQRWYEVASPREIGRRVDLCYSKCRETMLLVISRKVDDVPLTLSVLQSDYENEWQHSIDSSPSSLQSFRHKLPMWIRLSLRISLYPFVLWHRHYKRSKLIRLFYTRIEI